MVRLLLAESASAFLDRFATHSSHNGCNYSFVQAADFDELLRRSREEAPDIILMDEALTGFDPARDFDRLHEEAPESKLGLVCGALTTEKVARILGAGADGCIPRDLTLDAVPAVLALMAAGEKFVPAAMLPPSDAGLSDVAQDSYTVTRTAFPELTPREAAVLSMLVTGATNKEMADTLERKEITVTSHLKQIFRKLGASNRTEAAIVAFQRLYGVTPPPFAFPADAAALQKS